MAHTPFPDHVEPRNTVPGELTHTDVWGPSSTQALNGARYNVVLVDDSSRHLISEQVKTKDEACTRLQNYLTYIERQFGFKPKSVCFDQGKEFLNQKFIDWCADKGIRIETTAPYSPSQNGVAERFNHTIVELARAMIIARDVPKNLWHEAINYATYVRDKSFTRAIKGKTPDEGFTGQKPNVSHLQEFGSPVWVLNESYRSKLDPKSQKMLFVGFLEGPRAIKYYNARTKHIGTTRNYYFATAPPDTQFEGEEVDEPMGDQIESEELRNNNLKRKHPDDNLSCNERSKRPRKQVDYRLLDDPLLAYDPSPELTALANESPDECLPNEMLSAVIDRANLASEDPQSLTEARNTSEWPEWEKAVQIELQQLKDRKTWKLTDPPDDRTPIKNKWVFLKKYNKEGTLTKYKARLVAKGYSQIPGMDYVDVFSPVVRLESLRAILALAAVENWEICHMDVKGAYLNGILKEKIYMEQPEGFTDGTMSVCELIKTLYGLKQSGREWNIQLNEKLTSRGFKNLYSDPCVYIRWGTNDTQIITVWVDDLLIFTTTSKSMTDLKCEINEMFEVSDLGEPNKIVGIEISQDREKKSITIKQSTYIDAILKKYGMDDVNPVKTPMDTSLVLEPGESEAGNRSNNYASLIGSLMYAAVATRPDIAYAVNRLASFTANPTLSHWNAAKRIMRYLKGTINYGITYSKIEDLNDYVHGYSDASFANYHDRTSVSGYNFMKAEGAITWGSKKQNTVSLSSTEAEYICMSDAARDALWLRSLYSELGYTQPEPTLVRGDNLSSLAIAENPRYHKRTKHFDIKHHFIRDQIKAEAIYIKYCPTNEMTADIFTKALPRQSFEYHRNTLGVSST